MAIAPNGYRKHSTSVTYRSNTHGELTLYVQAETQICARYRHPQDEEGNSYRLWTDGQFDDHTLGLLACRSSTQGEDMVHWLKEEVLKFANLVMPVELG